MLLLPIQIACVYLLACAFYFTWRYARHTPNQGMRRRVLVFVTTLLSMAFVIVVFSIFFTSLTFTILRVWPPGPANDSIARANLLIIAAPAIGFLVGCIVAWFAGSRIVRAFKRRALAPRT